MKKTLSLVLAVVTLLTALFAFSGCTKAQNLDAIKKAGKLVVYTEAGFAPYEFMYENEIVGVDIEIMKKVAEKIGVELVVNDVAFNTICAAVKSGKTDAGAAGITINDERAEEVAFSIPYTSTEQYVVVKTDNTTITSVEDLKGKNIGVQEGTTSDLLVSGLVADKTLEGSTVTPYPAPAVAAAAIGKIDAVVTDKLTAETIVANNDGLKAFKLVKADGTDVVEVEKYGIAVNKKNEELLAVVNEVITELLASGQIAKWETEYTALAKQSSGEGDADVTTAADTTAAN